MARSELNLITSTELLLSINKRSQMKTPIYGKLARIIHWHTGKEVLQLESYKISMLFEP